MNIDRLKNILGKKINVGFTFIKAKFSIFNKKEIAVILICLILSSILYFFSAPSFQNSETITFIDFYDKDDSLKSHQSIIEFTNENLETIIEISIWFKGKGEVRMIVPSWFKEQKHYRNTGKVISEHVNIGKIKESHFRIDEEVDYGLLRQRFKADLFYKECRINRFSLNIDGLEDQMDVYFKKMDELNLTSFIPVPSNRDKYEYFSYKLIDDDVYSQGSSLEFEVVNEKFREQSEKTIFIIGILIGILCSIIADQILKLLNL